MSAAAGGSATPLPRPAGGCGPPPAFDAPLFPEAGSRHPALVRTVRERLETASARIAERFRAGVPAHVLVGERAALVDRVLVEAWRRFGAGEPDRHALVAVGGYGRGELHPGSDVDVLLLLRAKASSEEAEAIKRFVTFLWDVGLEVGNSVRTVRQCVEEAKRDVTVATNLMEARRLSGSEALFERMRDRTGGHRIWPSRRFFEAKWSEQAARHHKFDDTAYKLEPNVKEGPGGLRDIQMVGWVAKRHFGAETLDELVGHGFLTETELRSLVDGQSFLWQVRFALHVITGRREDRLLFDHQRALAASLGYEDDGHHLGVERFMKRYFREIMELSRLNELLLALFQEAILHAGRRRRVVDVSRRFRAVNGLLEAKRENVFKRYPFALLEVFLLLQQHPELEGVRASTIRLIRDSRHLIDDRFRADIRARSLFLEILRQPRGINHELRRMHRYGVLGAYLPVFEAVAGQMQYDLFHTYTVDEHSLFVVRNMRMFADPERYEEFPHCCEIFTRLPKPELLYVAGLFHDIAKGRGGDHSELGADLALEFCRHHGFEDWDSRFVAWLVRHHLLMSITAQRRDISDPDVISEFARIVGDHVHLDYLYLLTVADIRATNPNLWNDWKDALLWDLYQATLRALLRGLDKPVERAEIAAETQAEARRLLERDGDPLDAVAPLWADLGEQYFLRHTADEVAWHTRAILASRPEDLPLVLVREGRGGTDVFVYAPDQKFLFAATTSILGRLGLNIMDSRIVTADNGMTLDTYVVLDRNRAPIAEPEREEEIRAALHERLKSPATVPRRVRRHARRQLKHFNLPTEVGFAGDDANDRTIVEIIAGDRPGLLSRIGWALADAQVRLQNAKIATIGERAEDVFYVTDAHNRPLAPEALNGVRRAIVDAVDAPERG